MQEDILRHPRTEVIFLTTQDGYRVRVRVRTICCYAVGRAIDKSIVTDLYLLSGRVIFVRETPDQIDEMLGVNDDANPKKAEKEANQDRVGEGQA